MDGNSKTVFIVFLQLVVHLVREGVCVGNIMVNARGW